MSTCFKSASGGSVVVDYTVTSNADGTSTTMPRTDYAQCEFVMVGGADYGNWQQLVNMTPDEASVIGIQIGAVWAIAYGFKLVRRTLLSDKLAEE